MTKLYGLTNYELSFSSLKKKLLSISTSQCKIKCSQLPCFVLVNVIGNVTALFYLNLEHNWMHKACFRCICEECVCCAQNVYLVYFCQKQMCSAGGHIQYVLGKKNMDCFQNKIDFPYFCS